MPDRDETTDADDTVDPAADELFADERFAEKLRQSHEQLTEHGSCAPPDQGSSHRLRSAVKVLQWLEQWKASETSASTESEPVENEGAVIGSGDKLGRFTIRETIGRGGYGIVVRARDPKLGRDVALKIPRLDTTLSGEASARFIREAEMAAGLSHPGIVTVYETGEHQGIPFIVSEFVDGENLATLCARGQRFSPTDSAACLAELAAAVQHAHDSGVLHRDIKPSNVLVSRGGIENPKITDFGLARLVSGSDITHSGSVIGTPAYMSPEQAFGDRDKIGRAVDVYGLGAVLYQMLTGIPPFSGETIVEITHAIATEQPAPPGAHLPNCPKDLEAICLKCLEKNPGRRYESAHELGEDLNRFLSGGTVTARMPSLATRTWRHVRKHPLAAFAIAVIGILSVVGPIIATHQARLSRRAIQSEQQLQRSLYVSDMNLAFRDWQSFNVRRCGELLHRHIPRDGQTDHRDFEWYYLWNLWSRSNKTENYLEGLLFESIAISPDQRLLAIGCYDGTLYLHDLHQRREIRSWTAHGIRVIKMDFSADGSRLATTDAYRQVRIWDVSTGKQLHELEGQWSLDFASRADVFAYRNQRSVVIVSGTGQPDELDTQVIENADPRHVFAVCLSPDGKRIATAGRSGGVKIWDAKTLELQKQLREDEWIWSLDWSPQGDFLATGSGGGKIRIWETTEWEDFVETDGHANTVFAIGFSPSGESLASGSTDHTCRVWDVSTGELSQMLVGHSGEVTSLAYTDGGERLLTASIDGSLKHWTLEDWRARDVLEHPGPVSSANFSPDGESLITSCDDGKLRVFDVRSGQRRHVIDAHRDAAYSAQYLPFRGGQAIVSIGGDGRLRFWDAKSFQLQKEMESIADINDPLAISLSRDQQKIVFGRTRNTVAIWDLNGEKMIREIAIPDFFGLAFSPTDDLLAVTAGSHLSLWDSKQGQKIVSARADERMCERVVFSPDGKTIALASFDGNVKLFDVESFQRDRERATPVELVGSSSVVHGVAFSPDGNTIVSGGDDQLIHIWDARTGEERCVLSGHRGGVSSLQFSPDGQTLVSTGYDGTARLWRAPRTPVDSSRPPFD